MNKELLKIVECPECFYESLSIIETQKYSILNRALCCNNCDAEFSIVNGVPKLFTKTNSKRIDSAKRGFGYLFRLWNKGTFGYDSLYGQDEEDEEKAFLGSLSLKPQDLKNKIILDAGCGTGRLTLKIAHFSPKLVIGMDIQDSLTELPLQNKLQDNIEYLQGDLVKLPFKENQFDLVWCDGVLPYTYDYKRALQRLVRALKKGGKIYIWVYDSKLKSKMQKISELFPKSYKYPKWLILLLARLLGLLIFSIDKSAALIKNQSVKTPYQTRCFMFFDMLSQRYKTYFSHKQVQRLCLENNLNIKKTIRENGIGITAIKL